MTVPSFPRLFTPPEPLQARKLYESSSLAGGNQFGVAKKASLIAVKVLSDSGSGAVTDVVGGLNWIHGQAAASGRPSVVSLSIGGSASSALDNAVTSLTSAGVHVVVAAGGSNTDVSNTSPARVPSAITVGSTSIDDARASFSNYGAGVDIWAPGVSVSGAWSTSDTAVNSISGTTASTCITAGLVAYLIGKEGNKSPAALSDLLKAYCLKNVLTGIPSGTPNCLAHLT